MDHGCKHSNTKKNNWIRSYAAPLLQRNLDIPSLNKGEKKHLGRRVKSGDLGAQQKLIESNLRFVIRIARKFARNLNRLPDLLSVGNIGLIQAARRFDPDRNVRFTSYAVWWIRQALIQYLAKNIYAFPLPPKMTNILYRRSQVLYQESLDFEEISDSQRLATKIGVSACEINAALDTAKGTVSLNEPLGGKTEFLCGDQLEQTAFPSPEDQAVAKELRSDLNHSSQDY